MTLTSSSVLIHAKTVVTTIGSGKQPLYVVADDTWSLDAEDE